MPIYSTSFFLSMIILYIIVKKQVYVYCIWKWTWSEMTFSRCRLTLFSLGSVSLKQATMNRISPTASSRAKMAGVVKNISSSTLALLENAAPMRGPRMKPTEKAMPISAWKIRWWIHNNEIIGDIAGLILKVWSVVHLWDFIQALNFTKNHFLNLN